MHNSHNLPDPKQPSVCVLCPADGLRSANDPQFYDSFVNVYDQASLQVGVSTCTTPQHVLLATAAVTAVLFRSRDWSGIAQQMPCPPSNLSVRCRHGLSSAACINFYVSGHWISILQNH